MAIFALLEVLWFSYLPHILKDVFEENKVVCHKRQASVSSNYGGFSLFAVLFAIYVQAATLATQYTLHNLIII